jgi:ABC transporter DrrB family efflux protein
MSFFSDSFHLFVRWMKKLVRNPILIFFSLFQPVIFLVLFTQLFSKFGALLGPGVNYTVFATAGIVLQNAFSSAFQSGTAVVDDIRSGFLTKMLATPVNRTAILFGRILSDVFRVVVQTVIILVLAYALGVFPETGFPGYLLVIFTVAAFGLAWSGISLALGLRTKSAETVFGIAGFLTFPLLFMSTALVDTSAMPDWMKNVSNFNPISFAVNAMRNMITGCLPGQLMSHCTNGFDWSTILQAYGVIALIGVLTLGATLYLFRKIVS